MWQFCGQKTAIVAIFEVMNFDFWENLTFESVQDSLNVYIMSCKNGQNGSLHMRPENCLI